MTESSDYAWLLDRLAQALGPDVARGTLDSALAAIGRSSREAGTQDYRLLLRGPLRDRLRLSLGKRAAATWVEQAERDRFGPDLSVRSTQIVPPVATPAPVTPAAPQPQRASRTPTPVPESTAPSATPARPTPAGTTAAPRPARTGLLGRRASDLALALAQLRVETAQRGLERLRRDRDTSAVWQLAAEHTLELAQAELRRLEDQERLVKMRGDHLRRETWLEAVLARSQRQVLTLAFNEVTARHGAGAATPRELSEAKFALRQARDLVEGLEALGVPEARLGAIPRVPPVDLDLWLPYLDGHPEVRRTRQAVEIARMRVEHAGQPEAEALARTDLARAEAAAHAAREAATEELRARLATIRSLATNLTAWENAANQAGEVLARLEQQASSELDRERARLEVEQRRAVLFSTGHRLAESDLDLRLLLGGGPKA